MTRVDIRTRPDGTRETLYHDGTRWQAARVTPNVGYWAVFLHEEPAVPVALFLHRFEAERYGAEAYTCAFHVAPVVMGAR